MKGTATEAAEAWSGVGHDFPVIPARPLGSRWIGAALGLMVAIVSLGFIGHAADQPSHAIAAQGPAEASAPAGTPSPSAASTRLHPTWRLALLVHESEIAVSGAVPRSVKSVHVQLFDLHGNAIADVTIDAQPLPDVLFWQPDINGVSSVHGVVALARPSTGEVVADISTVDSVTRQRQRTTIVLGVRAGRNPDPR